MHWDMKGTLYAISEIDKRLLKNGLVAFLALHRQMLIQHLKIKHQRGDFHPHLIFPFPSSGEITTKNPAPSNSSFMLDFSIALLEGMISMTTGPGLGIYKKGKRGGWWGRLIPMQL